MTTSDSDITPVRPRGHERVRPVTSDSVRGGTKRRWSEPSGSLDAALRLDWPDVMMEALRASDDGNNPFYSDDEDTIRLAHELADAVLAALREAQP